jgi:hypothetical protein
MNQREFDDKVAAQDRRWTTLWDRPNRRVFLVAGKKPGDRHWSFVRHDAAHSMPGVYDVWRSNGDVVFVEIRSDEKDTPLGFPTALLSDSLLGSMTIWPVPDLDSFIWWS